MYSSGKDYFDKFDPNLYLQRYVSNDSRAQHQLRCFYDAFRVLPDNLKVLDYGMGPSLLAAMVAAVKSSEIVLSDYSPNNRQFLHKWFDSDPGAFDWTPHFNYLVKEVEGKGDEEVANSEKQLRAALKAVVHCDMMQDPPIEVGYDQLYDVVISSLVLDIAPRSNNEFVAVVRRIGNLVKTGGSLFLYLTENGPFYTVGDYTFECFPVNVDLVQKAMVMANFGDIATAGKFYSEPYTYFFIKGVRK